MRACEHTRARCVCVGPIGHTCEHRLRAWLCAYTRGHVGVDTGLCVHVLGPCCVCIHVCAADSWGEQAGAHMGQRWQRPRVPGCGPPGTCPAPPPAPAVGIRLCAGEGRPALRSGGRGATWPSCCLKGPRKPAPSPLNRTNSPPPHTRAHVGNMRAWTHDTRGTARRHMRVHALVHTRARTRAPGAWTRAFTHDTRSPIAARAGEERDNRKVKNRPHQGTGESPRGAGEEGPRCGSWQGRPLRPERVAPPLAGVCS